MEVRFANRGMIPALREIWGRCFGDPEAYVSLFFERRFRPSQTLVACEGGKPASMLFLLPCEAASGGKRYPARYLYGVATDPGHQGRGLSSLLLERAHGLLKEEGVSLSFLVPASKSLVSFYEKRGFAPGFYLTESAREYTAPKPGVRFTESSFEREGPLRNRFFAESSLFIKWDREALAYQDLENGYTGAKVLAFCWEGEPGYVFCVPREDGVLIKELVAPTQARETVLESVAAHFKRSMVSARLPQEEDPRLFAMIKWYERIIPEGKAKPYLSLVLD